MAAADILSWLREIWTENEPPRWFVIAVPTLYAIYKFMTWNLGVFKRLGVRGPRPWPVLGTMLPFIRLGLSEHDPQMKRQYGSIVGTFFGRKPTMLIYDLELLKEILVKEFSNFTNRNVMLVPDYPLDNLLSVIQDDHWKHVRNTLTPTFSSGKLRKMQQQIEKCAETLVANLQQKADANETFDLRDYCGAFTMDAIASTAFGLQIDSHNDPNNPFIRMGSKAFDFSFRDPKMIIALFFPFLAEPLRKLGISMFPRDATDFFARTVDKALEERRMDTTDQSKVDFLQLMVNAEAERDEDDFDRKSVVDKDDVPAKQRSDGWKSNRRGLTHDEVLAQAILFFLAGYETTANTLSFVGYLLAVNNECQEKLIAEIDSVMHGQDHVSFDVINKMPYLDQCISETLRLYPPVPRVDRVSREDITINGVFIPKGMVVGIPIYALQNDPEYWPQPEKFIPERFMPEAKEARNPYCYMPFGMGPRNCIGMRLALMEMKVALVHILRKFRFVVCEETQVPLILEKMRVRGTEGLKLRVKPRTELS